MWQDIHDVDLRLDLERATHALTEKQREALEYYLMGYSFAEIGSNMEVGESAACRRVRRAIQVLRVAM